MESDDFCYVTLQNVPLVSLYFHYNKVKGKKQALDEKSASKTDRLLTLSVFLKRLYRNRFLYS